MENQEVQEVQTVKKVRTSAVDAKRFVQVWQKHRGNADAIHAELGGNRNHILHRANTLRKNGVPLIAAQSSGRGGKLDFDMLAKIAAEMVDET